MPTIDLVNEQGVVDRSSTHKLHALMCHPAKSTWRRELEVTYRVRDSLSFDQVDLAIPMQWVGVILDAPSMSTITRRATKAWATGAVVGDILLFVLNCAEHDPRNATVRRAIHCIREDLVGRKSIGGEMLNVGLSTIARDWGQFRCVAHLWAAFQLLRRDANREPIEFLDDGILEFVALAERLRLMGESHHPPYPSAKNRPTLLDPNETWKASADLVRPVAGMVPPQLSGYASSLLAEYKARKS